MAWIYSQDSFSIWLSWVWLIASRRDMLWRNRRNNNQNGCQPLRLVRCCCCCCRCCHRTRTLHNNLPCCFCLIGSAHELVYVSCRFVLFFSTEQSDVWLCWCWKETNYILIYINTHTYYTDTIDHLMMMTTTTIAATTTTMVSMEF